jgi:hypothetical protein
MNNPNTKLFDLIHVERGVIPIDLCDDVVKNVQTRPWKSHAWYSNITDTRDSNETKEFGIQFSTIELQEKLTSFVIESGKKYNNKYAYQHPSCVERTGRFIFNFNSIRFNRYEPGQIMRQHHDHIHDIFDGQNKGIPVLSFILNFNDDYEGADLFFWEDTVIKLGKGDIVMFPSCFLFPHGVTEATKGKRYSAVTWGW